MEAGPYADNIPHLIYCGFQMMFAVITPALLTGSLVGRVRFKALVLFVILWSLVVYYPLAHMVWGEGGWSGLPIARLMISCPSALSRATSLSFRLK